MPNSSEAPESEGECSRRVLAESETAVLEHCSCGALYLEVGPVSLRLASVLSVGLAQLGREAPARSREVMN
jgi:hypothetical protein